MVETIAVFNVKPLRHSRSSRLAAGIHAHRRHPWFLDLNATALGDSVTNRRPQAFCQIAVCQIIEKAMPAGGLEPPRQLAADFKSAASQKTIVLSMYYESDAVLVKILDEIVPRRYAALSTRGI
jgi:hypothetical protein